MSNLTAGLNGVYQEGLPTAKLFGWPEYLVFGLMLAISAAIGLYHGCTGKNTTKEFLMGGKNLGVFPVASSLIASFISAITLLGQPSEVYTFGTIFWMVGISYPLMLFVAAFIYLPVFYDLQLTSAFEYLELRFSRPVRLIVSAISMLNTINYLAIVVFAPSLALSQVTGMNVYGCVVAIYAICTFYTTIGGLKAVVWTDTLQLIIMFAATTLIVFKGAYDVGGPAEVWRIASEGGRIEFINFDLDPRTRHTLWGLFIGSYFMWLATYGCNQAQVQRYLSVPTMRKAQWALFINFFGLFGILTLSCYAGLVVYAKYATCDPIISKKVTTADQLFPLFVMETVGHFPGLPGLFVAGVFSGTLSTVSTGLNSLAAITLEDFVKGLSTRKLSEAKATKISKMIAVFFALMSFGLVFVAEHLGQILTASISIGGTMGGPILGLFTLGMCFPWTTSKGAICGSLTGLAITVWICVGAQIARAQQLILSPKLPVSVEGCEFGNFTLFSSQQGFSPVEDLPSGGLIELYRISYMWYPAISCSITVFVGLIVSFITGRQDPRRVNPKLISPGMDYLMRKVLPYKMREAIGWEDLGVEFKAREKELMEIKPLTTYREKPPRI